MLNEIRLKIADFLNTVLLDGKIISLDLWHMVHFISGGIVMFFILKFYKKSDTKRLFLLMFLLFLYEFVEWIFIINGSSLFRLETEIGTFLDLVIGFLGGFLFLKLKRSFFH